MSLKSKVDEIMNLYEISKNQNTSEEQKRDAYRRMKKISLDITDAVVSKKRTSNVEQIDYLNPIVDSTLLNSIDSLIPKLEREIKEV
tara:strand:- start:344 stop:604 length:261 start_codon:yes stop_codon:yes gene_type:complete